MTRQRLEECATLLTMVAMRREQSGVPTLFAGVERRILAENEDDIRDATAARDFAEACDAACVRRMDS